MTFYDISVTMNNPKYWNSVICFFVNVYKMSKLTKLKATTITVKCCIYCVQTIYTYMYLYHIIDKIQLCRLCPSCNLPMCGEVCSRSEVHKLVGQVTGGQNVEYLIGILSGMSVCVFQEC